MLAVMQSQQTAITMETGVFVGYIHTDERYDIFSIYVMRKPRKFKGCGFEY